MKNMLQYEKSSHTRSHRSDNFARDLRHLPTYTVEFLPFTIRWFSLMPKIFRQCSCLNWGIFRLLSCTQPISILPNFKKPLFPELEICPWNYKIVFKILEMVRHSFFLFKSGTSYLCLVIMYPSFDLCFQ